jgi:low temperature requirement protein LtrA
LRRHRSYLFGYGHIPIFAAIAATGAGLHVAAYFIDHEAHISAAIAVASIVVPVALFKLSLTWLYSAMVGADRTIITVAAFVLVVLAGSIGLAAAGASVPVCLLVIVLALAASIVIDERRGSERLHQALQKLEAEAAS